MVRVVVLILFSGPPARNIERGLQTLNMEDAMGRKALHERVARRERSLRDMYRTSAEEDSTA